MEEISPVTFPLTGTNLTVNVECAACRHFKGVPAAGFRKTCSNLGIIKESKPCHRFSVSADQIKLGEPNYAKMLAMVIRHLPTKKLMSIAALLIQERRTRAQGFTLGEKVHFVMSGGAYLNNYRTGWVIAADKNTVFISASKDDSHVSLALMHSSVVKAEDWKAKRKQLIADRRIDDPKQTVYRPLLKSHKKLLSYVPPTIDDMPNDRVVVNKALSARRGVDVEIKDSIKTISIRRKTA